MLSNLDNARNSLQTLSLKRLLRSRDNDDQPAPLCSVCVGVDLRDILREGLVKEKAIDLGLLPKILEKAEHCVLCRLVKAAFQESWFLDTLPEDIDLSEVVCGLYADPRGCLRDPEPPMREHCHRLVIFPKNRPKRISQVLMTRRSRMTVDIQLMEQDAHLLGRPKDVHGRKVGDTVDMGLVKKWIKQCEREHHKICENLWWRDKTPLPSTVRMVDVKKMSIVPIQVGSHFLALSYVWGRISTDYQTVKANLPRRMKSGGLDISTLPATIVDAIELTRRLGERYLWIDALCIIQDSPEDKGVQLSVMDRIYSGSFLTIFAAGGVDAHAGLPGWRSNTRKVKQQVETIQGLHLSAPFPNLNGLLYQSTWGSRGWTFQEVMLSRRRLCFTEYQVYFECVQEVRCEDVITEAPPIGGSYHPLRYTGIGGFATHEPPIPGLAHVDGITNSYSAVVDEYSPRKLTFDNDAIEAVSALITAIVKAYQLDAKVFRYGMLLSDMDRTLLWSPVTSVRLERRRIPEGSPWPSWSWVGWKGPVQYVDKWSLGQSYPRVAATLIKSWYIFENGALSTFHSKQTSVGSPLGETIQRYHQPTDPIELTEDVSLPEGTLVFRSATALFNVGDLDLDKTFDLSADAHYGLFAIYPAAADTPAAAGRIFIPLLPGSMSEPEHRQIRLIPLARNDGEIGICDTKTYSTSYQTPFLTVMAVTTCEREGYTPVFERLGVGIVSEQAWIVSGARECIAFLG